MYSHILVPTDGSELSIEAARKAIDLAKLCNAKMTTIMVSPTYHQMNQEGFIVPTSHTLHDRWGEEMAQRATPILNGICAHAEKAGVACKALHVFGDSPYEAIIEAAEKNGCDMIAMGSHGHGGVKQLFLGSETARVLSHTKIPVLVYR
jgi:nucleotide-binding universal stress UspA family protein